MKKRVIRPLFLTAALSMVLSNGAFAYEGIDTLPDLSDYPTRVMVDGQYVTGPVPVLQSQEADLSLRVILESADYTVSWDNHTRTVIAVSPSGTEYRIVADTGTVTKNNAVLCQDNRIGLSSGSLYVSEETLDRMEGFQVDWDPATNTAVVFTDTPDDNLYGYDLGESTVKNSSGRPDTPYRMQGIVGVPEGENRPIAVILHGAHPIGTASENRYDLGFSYLVDALADAGYLAISMNVAINYSFEDGEPTGNERTIQVVEQQLEQLEKAINGEETAFPVDLTGKGDLEQVVLLGQSRGGCDIFAVAEAMEQQIGVVGLLSMAPSKTVFLEDGVSDIPVSILLPQYDGDVTMLDGATMFEDIRNNDTTTAELIYLEDGNHGGFSTALVRPDPFGRPEDLDKTMPAAEQQALMEQYAVQFMDAITVDHTTPMNRETTLPDMLYGRPVVIRTYDGEKTLFQAQEQNITTVTAQNATVKAVNYSYVQQENTAGMFNLPGSFQTYGLLQLDWQKDGASVTIPVQGTAGEALRLDLAQDSTSAANGQRDLSLSVTVTSRQGKTATVTFPEGTAPLRHQAGEAVSYDNWDGTVTQFYSTFTPLGSLLITESQLNGIQLEDVQSVTLNFTGDSGTIMLRQIAVQ